ncbi:MAG: GNAT family N-acetyltransferase [Myxococcales bacterium]|nr:GNAT family N-acetyltransferase [Myxococcales bacterium]
MDVRPAVSPQERLAVLRIAHAANQSRAPFEAYAARRLAVAFRGRADWWVGFDGDVAVASLLCHRFVLARGAARRKAFGLGSVAVHPDHQRRGHANALCDWVVQRESPAVGLLFSAVPPKVYEGCGFRVLPAWSHRSRDLQGLADSGTAATLTPIDPRTEIGRLAQAWSQDRGHFTWARTLDDWHRSLLDNPEDLWFATGDGTLRLAQEGDELEVVELTVEDRAAALRAVALLAIGLGKDHVTGWFPPDAFVSRWFEDTGRATTLPMAARLPADEPIWLSSADYF